MLALDREDAFLSDEPEDGDGEVERVAAGEAFDVVKVMIPVRGRGARVGVESVPVCLKTAHT